MNGRPFGSITPQEIDALHKSIAGKAVANAAIRCSGSFLIGPPAVTTFGTQSMSASQR